MTSHHSDVDDGLIRARRRTLTYIVPVGSGAALVLAVVAVGMGTPRLLTWAAVAAWSAAVAGAQLLVRSYDLRVFALAHSTFVLVVMRWAPADMVVAIVPLAAVVVTVIIAVMGRSRSFAVTAVIVNGIYAGAVLTVSRDAVALAAIVVAAAGGLLSWLLLTNLVRDVRAGQGTYRQLFDRVPVGLYRTSVDGRIIDCNPALAGLLGTSPDLVIGTNARDWMFDREDLDDLRARVEMEGGTAVSEYRFVRADGSVAWMRDQTTATTDAAGSVEFYEGELQDVTEQRRHVEELEQLVRSKSELIAAVSHELRTPLTAVVGFLDLLDDSEEAAEELEKRELLALAVEQAHEVSSIIEDLLTAARIENEELVVRSGVVRIADEVDAAVRSLGVGAVGSVRSNVGLDALVLGDPGRVRQILRNLLGNGIRYGTPPVTVRSERTDVGTVGVVVADTGEEIPEATLDRVFDAFVSGPADSGKPGSIGIGLSVSRHLARLMGGDLFHRRRNDETQFVLNLPAASAD